MRLGEAYRYIGPPHGKDRAGYDEAFRVIIKKVKKIAAKEADTASEADELVSVVCGKLIRTGSADDEVVADARAQSFLWTIVKNAYKDMKRKEKTRQKYVKTGATLDSKGDEDEGALDLEEAIEDERGTGEGWLQIDEDIESSRIFEVPREGRAGGDSLDAQAYGYLKRQVVEEVVSRSDAQANMRQSIEEMRAMVDGEVDTAELARRELREEREGDTESKARARFQRRHTNTRKRLKAWLEESAPEADLTSFDRKVLGLCIEGLYLRDQG